jgi:hypothetical protein
MARKYPDRNVMIEAIHKATGTKIKVLQRMRNEKLYAEYTKLA